MTTKNVLAAANRNWTLEIEKMDKFQVRDLFDLIAGGRDKPITASHISNFQPVILAAVLGMKRVYEGGSLPKDYEVRKYYSDCWLRFEGAGDDPQKLADAVNYLRESIRWQ